jgi:hypothetical protein
VWIRTKLYSKVLKVRDHLVHLDISEDNVNVLDKLNVTMQTGLILRSAVKMTMDMEVP